MMPAQYERQRNTNAGAIQTLGRFALMINLSRLLIIGVLALSIPPAWADDAASAAAQAPATAETAAAPAAADAAAAAPTEPQLIGTDKINSGDTAWMLSSTALVLMMTIPGLALFYGGMVRKKNVLATLMQSFAVTCVVTLLWWLIGYSWAFTPGSSAYLGGASRFLMNGMTVMKDANKVTVSHLALTIPETVYAMFQLTFAIITPALIAGSFADRMKFSSMLVFMSVWSLVVYCPIAHWVWEPSGWLAVKGVLDYAGGTVVHINAGIAGLMSCLVLGKRIGYNKEAMPPHNLTLTLIGASLLWVGWFGFNAGSAVAADGRAGMAMAATQIATALAALGWMFAEWVVKGKPSVLGIASGAVAGLVAITPASGFVGPTSAVIIGVVAGVLCFFAATSLKSAMGYDDSLDAFGVHCIGGIIGALLTGVFASKEISGADGSVITQLWGVGTTLIYGGVASFIILKVIDMTIGLRVTEEQEREGLDISLHGERVE
jgi:Amt family ammonium transporter